MDKKSMLEKASAFHGHTCGGLLIGVSAAHYAMELLGTERSSQDEEIVCVAENDSCSVDGIQSIMGCSAGKGNLIFRMRGKQAFSFFNRQTGKSFRLVLKDLIFSTPEEKRDFMLTAPGEDIFEVKETPFDLPPKAKIFKSQNCSICGELTAEPWLRVQCGKEICIDCLQKNDPPVR
ncbi:MAG TPA: formylmethanofuran dehydrogenase [Synergistaceae bacterium]|nr:formylmethanofuran dehydrogenase [Synergistaceae bacterium]